MGTGVYGKSVLSTKFCCEPRTALKIKFFLIKRIIILYDQTGFTPETLE